MSPAATFTIDDADRLVLDAADTLFYERGISGVGMAELDLGRAAGMMKRHHRK